MPCTDTNVGIDKKNVPSQISLVIISLDPGLDTNDGATAARKYRILKQVESIWITFLSIQNQEYEGQISDKKIIFGYKKSRKKITKGGGAAEVAYKRKNVCRVVLCNLKFLSIKVEILLLSTREVCTGMGIRIGNKLCCYIPTLVVI